LVRLSKVRVRRRVFCTLHTYWGLGDVSPSTMRLYGRSTGGTWNELDLLAVCPIRIQATLFAACRDHLVSVAVLVRCHTAPPSNVLFGDGADRVAPPTQQLQSTSWSVFSVLISSAAQEYACACSWSSVRPHKHPRTNPGKRRWPWRENKRKKKGEDVGRISLRELLYLVGLTGVKEVSAGLLLSCHTVEA